MLERFLKEIPLVASEFDLKERKKYYIVSSKKCNWNKENKCWDVWETIDNKWFMNLTLSILIG